MRRAGALPGSVRRQEPLGPKTQKPGVASAAVTAAALQDHLMRKYRPAGKSKAPKPLPQREYDPDKDEFDEDADDLGASLTLAQRIGVVKAPEKLSKEDWLRVREMSRQRGDSSQPCVICREDFGGKQQVILSCSHVFHRSCLESFEKFANTKACPLCRKEDYQKRVFLDGQRAHRIKCATKIQAAFRMSRQKKEYQKLRLRAKPSDPSRVKVWCADKLNDASSRMLDLVDNGDEVDNLFAEIESSLKISREIFGNPVTVPQVVASVAKQHLCQTNVDENAVPWKEVEKKALARGDTDCSICLCELGLAKKRVRREVVLLSCTHVFHSRCLKSFEELGISEDGPVCPMCRAKYEKKHLTGGSFKK